MPDSLQTPPDDESGRPIFAETRASTLIPKTPPTSGSQTLVPTPEIVPEVEAQFAPEPVEIEFTQPQISFETPSAPASKTATEAATAPETAPASEVATAPAIIENPAFALSFAPAPDAPFQSSVTVGIACKVHDARIFYTLDGSAPDQTSTLYTPEKILLTQSATLRARAFGSDENGPICSADYVVSKPMWQELEPADQSDATPHKSSENLKVHDGWRLSAASVRGKLHAHRALWREDAFALGNAGNWSISIVSDGAGSAPLSRVGSRVASEAALESLRLALGAIEIGSDDVNAALPRVKAALVEAAGTALRAIRDQSAARNQPIAAFAATLLVLVRRAVGDSQLCAAIQIGDGAIALDCQSGLKLLGAADHGQHSSETRFLTTNGIEADLVNRVKFSLPADLRATLVVSDGVSDDYFPEDKRLNEVFDAVKPLVQHADDAGAALLNWLGYEKKGSSDDRTIALSWPISVDAIDSLEAELAEFEADGGRAEPQNFAVSDDAATSPESNTMETRDGV